MKRIRKKGPPNFLRQAKKKCFAFGLNAMETGGFKRMDGVLFIGERHLLTI